MDDVYMYLAGHSWKSWGLIFISILILKIILKCIYLLTLHPLAKYPGPPLARLTTWYSAWHAYKGDLHLRMNDAHEKYGDIVRFGPDRILFNTATGLHEIYNTKNVHKSKGYLTIIPTPGAYSVHTAIDKAMHRRKRTVLSQGLSHDVLRTFEPLMLEHVRKFCGLLISGPLLADGWTRAKNMADYCDHLTFDIMGLFGFGREFDMQTSPKNRFLISAIAASNIRTSIYGQYPALAKFKLDKILYPKGAVMRQKFLDLTRRFAEERVSEGAKAKNDLFSFVIDAKDPETGEGFTLDELWSESKFLIVAGSDTSSTVLAATFFYLTRNPSCYAKVTTEIRSTFSSLSSIISSPALNSCVYLRACLYESMRMSPPAGGALWRESESVTIDSHHIPAGIDVGTSIYAIHHKETYFPNPHSFKPERWIAVNEDDEARIELQHRVLNPFSLGSRGCIGRGLAYMELGDTMAMVVWLMDFRRPEGGLGRVGEGRVDGEWGRRRVGEFQLKDHLTSTKDGPYVEFRRREM